MVRRPKYPPSPRATSDAPRFPLWDRFLAFPRSALLSLIGVFAVVAAVVYAWALWRVPDLLHAHSQQDRYNARVLVTSVGGAVVVCAGLLYTARNYGLSVRGQIADRFSNALERLSSQEMYVRMGGVHALEHVMHDSPDQHNDVVEILAAFIRNRAPYSRWSKQEQAEAAGPPGVAPDTREGFDVQAALTALGRRRQRPERRPLQLFNTNLRGALLFEADLRGAVLDAANLSSAFLSGADLSNATLAYALLCNAHLEKTGSEPPQSIKTISSDFTRDWLRETPRKKLAGANLSGANLTGSDLSGANLIGVNLSGSDLRASKLGGAELKEANLSGAFMPGADLSGMDLSGANLSGANLSQANLRGAQLHDTNLARANLSRVDLSGMDLSEMDLSGMDLRLANLSGANLRGAQLHDTNLARANLSDVDLSGMNLSRTNLAAANLRGAQLHDTDLSGVDLSGVDLSGMDLSGANLRDVKLRGANLSDATIPDIDRDWSGADLTWARVSPDTQLPTGWQSEPRPGYHLVRPRVPGQLPHDPRPGH